MPLGRYDRYFGGRDGAASRARAGMRSHYGPDEGERIFNALLAKRRAQGKDAGGAVLRAMLAASERRAR